MEKKQNLTINKSPFSFKGIFITIIIILTFGIGLSYLLSRQSSLSLSQQQITDQEPLSTQDRFQYGRVGNLTKDWNTHVDKAKGFSIKFPPTWVVQTNPAKGYGYSFQSPDLHTGDNNKIESGLYLHVTIWLKEQDLELTKNPNLSPMEWFAEYSKKPNETIILSDAKEEVLAGYPAIVFMRNIATFGVTQTTIVFGESKLLQFNCFYAEERKFANLHTCQTMIATLQLL